MTKPVRLQLSRRKGFNLQAASAAINGLPAATVARPSIFGNPYSIASAVDFHAGFGQPENGETPRQTAVRWFKEWLDGKDKEAFDGKPVPTRQMIRDHLKGKNLACWCRLDQACHADVLLELANQ